MAKEQKWIEITVRVPIEIKRGKAGLWYVTSPFIRGLLVAEKTEAEALDRVPQAIQDHAIAAADIAAGAG